MALSLENVASRSLKTAEKKWRKNYKNHNRWAKRKKKSFSLGALQNAPPVVKSPRRLKHYTRRNLTRNWKIKKKMNEKYFYMCKLQFYNENKSRPFEKWLHAVRERALMQNSFLNINKKKKYCALSDQKKKQKNWMNENAANPARATNLTYTHWMSCMLLPQGFSHEITTKFQLRAEWKMNYCIKQKKKIIKKNFK